MSAKVVVVVVSDDGAIGQSDAAPPIMLGSSTDRVSKGKPMPGPEVVIVESPGSAEGLPQSPAQNAPAKPQAKATESDSAGILGLMWDAIPTTKQRLKFLTAIAAAVVTIFGGGFKLGMMREESKRDALQAKHERELTDARQNVLDDIHSSLDSEDVPVVPFDEAVVDSTSFVDYEKRLLEVRKKHTSIQRDLAAEDAGKRFRWTGYVFDVDRRDSDGAVGVALASKDTFYGLIVLCIFEDEKYYSTLEKLQPTEEIVVEGVLDDSGALRHCRLATSNAP